MKQTPLLLTAFRWFTLWAFGVGLWTLDLHAAPSPRLIPFQGRLTDQQGRAYTNGQFTVVFNLYSQAVGGTPVWTERHQKVGVINGMVNVFLGSITALDAVDFSTTMYLGITIDADDNLNTADPEMVPRQMIIPAFWAKNSEKLNGFDWTPIFNANSPVGPIPGGKIQNNTITAGQIAAQTITATQIANNTITSQQLAGAIITSNQIVAGSISSQNLAPGSVKTTSIADGAVTLPKLAPMQVGTNVGIGGLALSPSLSQLNLVPNNTASWVVAIQTTGRPVVVQLVPANNQAGSVFTYYPNVAGGYGTFVLQRAANGQTNTVSSMQVGQGDNGGGNVTIYGSPNAVSFLDVPPTGTNTYTISFTATGYVTFENIQLMAVEL